MHDLFHVYMYVCMDVFAHCLSNVVALRIFVCVSMWRQNNLVHVINAMGKSNPSMNTHIASQQASQQASEQACKQASKQASKQARKQASKQASQQASQQASKPASKPASKQLFFIFI